jgi:uroporphyrinogen decarboxylase
MESKERVMIAMLHQEADRIPLNFRATEEIIHKLSLFLNLDYEGLLNHFKVDFREVIPPYVGPNRTTGKPGRFVDIWGVERFENISEIAKTTYVSYHPLKDVTTPKEISKHVWPRAEWFDFTPVAGMCKHYQSYAISSPGIHCEGWHGVFHQLTYLFGMEKVLMDLVMAPDLIKAAIDEIMKFLLRFYERLLQSAEGMLDFVFYKDDFGTQDNLMISRQMFLDYFYPNIQALVELCNSYGAKLIMHSCGSVFPIIPDFIKAGVTVLDPIQVTAKDMNICVLKREFGDALTFHGGIDIQRLMPRGTIEEIDLAAKETIETLGKGGGYFFSPSHRFQNDTPVENIMTLYNSAFRYGMY